jgi:hypothetical protein
MLNKAIYAITKLAEDPTGLQRPLWRDISMFQRNVNFDIMAANGVYACFARAGISWGYKDPMFHTYYAGLQKAGIFRASYHVLYPDQPVRNQVDNWYEVHPETEIVPRAIDLELGRGVAPSQIADATWEMSEFVKSRDGVRPIIYSRAQLIDLWLADWEDWMLNDHWFWLAQYLFIPNEHSGPPTLPARVREDRVILHQTSGKKPGFPGEVQSAAVDWDRWELGDYQAMVKFVHDNWGGEEPPPPPQGETYRFEVEKNGVNKMVGLEELREILGITK